VTDLDDLLNLRRPKWAIREIAVLGGPWEDDLTIARGYLEAAEITARHWIEHGPDDGLPIHPAVHPSGRPRPISFR
jgi:hypothetical protein